MKRSFTSMAGLVVAFGLALAVLAVPGHAGGAPTPAGEFCDAGVFGPGRIAHWDKIIFRAIPGNFFLCPPNSIDPDNLNDFQINNNSVLDIKVEDDPALVADVKAKVANFLNNLGCQRQIGGAIEPRQVDIIDVEYAIVCTVLSP